MTTRSPFALSDEHRYFLEIEVLFNQLRGSAALLSPADWHVAKNWWQRHIPLPVVRAALDNVFEQRRERGDAGRVQSLKYCESAVDNAFRQLEELGYGVAPAAQLVPVRERLEAIAQRLGADAALWRERILACASKDAGDVSAIEQGLAEVEGQMARQAFLAIQPEPRGELEIEIEAHLDRALEPLRARVDRQTLASARARLRDRVLRERLGVPRLTLFAPPEAAAVKKKGRGHSPQQTLGPEETTGS